MEIIMRFLPVATILVLAITSPALAQNAGHNFGRITCQPIECPAGIGNATSNAALAAVGNSCITKFFGYSNSTGFFDNDIGLDANNCLSPIPGILPKSGNANLVPSCCIVPQTGTDSCLVHCEINAQ